MESDDLDVRFFPLAALSDSERADWHRIILSEIREADGCLTVVFVQDPTGWVLEGFFLAAPDGGFSQLSPGHYRPLRRRVVGALRSAGKSVRAP